MIKNLYLGLFFIIRLNLHHKKSIFNWIKMTFLATPLSGSLNMNIFHGNKFTSQRSQTPGLTWFMSKMELKKEKKLSYFCDGRHLQIENIWYNSNQNCKFVETCQILWCNASQSNKGYYVRDPFAQALHTLIQTFRCKAKIRGLPI